MVKFKSIINIIEVVVTLYLFICVNPFLLWVVWPPIINIPLFLCIIISTLFLLSYNKLVISFSRVLISFCVFVFCLYMTTSVLGHSFDLGKFMSFTSLGLLCFYPSSIYLNVFNKYKKALKFFCIASLIVFVLVLVKLEPPFYKIPAFSVVMKSLNAYYKLYGVVVSSTNTMYNIAGFSIGRICGPFLEPGHFAIYLGITVFIDKVIYNKISTLFIIVGILTFSPAFIFFLFFVISYDIIKNKNISKVYLKWFVFSLPIIAVLLTNDKVIDQLEYLIIGRNFESNGFDFNSVIDDRAGKRSMAVYNRFAGTPDVYFGKGVEFVEELGVLSDLRGMIFKFGILGLVLSMFIWLSMLRNIIGKLLIYYVIAIITLIASHRSWMLESPYIYIMILILIYLYENYNSNVVK